MEMHLVERPESDDDILDVTGSGPSGRLRRRPEEPPAVGLEQRAARLRATGHLDEHGGSQQFRTRPSSPEHAREMRRRSMRSAARDNDSQREVQTVRIKKERPLKAKGNESPFNVRPGLSQHARVDSKAMSHSSPLNPNPSALTHHRYPPATSEPRPRARAGGERHDGQPSSPTMSTPSRLSRQDGFVYELLVQRASPCDNAVASSSRLPTINRSNFITDRELIHVDDSDNDEIVDNDEALPPPQPPLDQTKRFESTGFPRTTAPVTRARRYAADASNLDATSDQQANGHQAGRSSYSKEEEEEEIEMFSSYDNRPELPSQKGKEKAPTPPERPPASRTRRPMQGKDGKVIARDAPRVRHPLKPATQHIASSFSRVTINVKEFYIDASDEARPLSRLAIERSSNQLIFVSEQKTTHRIKTDAIAALYICRDDNLVVDFHLSVAEVDTLRPFLNYDYPSDASVTDYTHLRTLCIVEDAAQVRNFVREAARVDSLKNKIEAAKCSGIECMRYGPMGSDNRKSKALSERPAARVKAAQAAERRLAESGIAIHAKRATAAVTKTVQDSRQSTLKLQPSRKSSRLAASGTRDRRYHETSPHPEQDRILASDSPPVDKKQFLFHLHGLDITAGERYRLESNDFLNDTFLEFGLRYVLDSLPQATRDEVHCFNSFFYSKLSEKPARKFAAADESWPAYDAVKRWTKKAEIFNKKFIVIPVNESYHWYLAVIYNPRATLDRARAARPTLSNALRDAEALREDLASRESSVLPRLSSEDRDTGGVTSSRHSANSHDSISRDADPLNIIDQADDEQDNKEEGVIGVVRAGVDKLQLKAQTPDHGGVPQPIHSLTYDVFTAQSLGDLSTEVNAGESAVTSPTLPPVKKGKKPGREDFDIIGSCKTWIITFDSMGSRHPSVATNLQRWLQCEAKDKLGEDADFASVPYLEGKCLEQPNFYDCGLYLIHFAKQLLRNSEEVLRFIGYAPRTRGVEGHEEWKRKKAEVWATHESSQLRQEWVHIIDTETQKYRSLNEANTSENVAREALPPESQVSVQALSGPQEAGVETYFAAQARSPNQMDVVDDIQHPSSPDLSRREALSLSPDREGSPPPPASFSSPTGKDARGPGANRLLGAPRPRVSDALSESEEEEQIEEGDAGKVPGVDDHSPQGDVGSSFDKPYDALSHARLHHDHGDVDLSCRPTIDPSMPLTQDNAHAAVSSALGHRYMVLGSYPGAFMDTAEVRHTEEIDHSNASPSHAHSNLCRADLVDPFADLGNAQPIHRESGDGDRIDPWRSSTSHVERRATTHNSTEPLVLVSASSSISRSSSAALAETTPRQPSGSPVYLPYQMRHMETVPQPIFVDEDSPDEVHTLPATAPRPQPSSSQERQSNRVRLSPELSHHSPGLRRPLSRRKSRPQLPLSSDDDAQRTSPTTHHRRPVRRRSKSPGQHTGPSRGEGYGVAEKPKREPSSQMCPTRINVKHAANTNGRALAVQPKSELLGDEASPLVIDDDDADEQPHGGSSRPQRHEREPSLELTKPKRPASKTYARTSRNKRRKTEKEASSQQTIVGFLGKGPDERKASLAFRKPEDQALGSSAQDAFYLTDDDG